MPWGRSPSGHLGRRPLPRAVRSGADGGEALDLRRSALDLKVLFFVWGGRGWYLLQRISWWNLYVNVRKNARQTESNLELEHARTIINMIANDCLICPPFIHVAQIPDAQRF